MDFPANLPTCTTTTPEAEEVLNINLRSSLRLESETPPKPTKKRKFLVRIYTQKSEDKYLR
ncbi:hypothetical protein CHS0354_038204 [Potamilus streckersoni]|uniref:Uncharacterized protein n=1 Tax=Potamilus streckersoni TaxID=2493646 RepID=A0AAE0T0V3_9BIVA|nr:hypothetical protein CHS0354_038204 [Potamilus streckersoni]